MEESKKAEKKPKSTAFLAAKAKSLAVPSDFKNVNERRRGEMRNGKDLGTVLPLAVIHKEKLRNLLSTFIQEHKWREAAGVLGVLLPTLSRKGDRQDNRQNFYFWSAMEVLRQLESPSENMARIRRLFNLLRAHTNKNRQFERIRGGIDLELALYLVNQDDLEGAYNLSRIVVDVPSFRDDPAVHLFHGLILHKLWYKKVMEDIKVDNGNVEYIFQSTSGDSLEGFGENVDDVLFEEHHALKACLSSDFSSIIPDEFANQSTNFSMLDKKNELLDWTIFESSRFSHEEYDEDKESLMEGDEEFLESIIVPSSSGLDDCLFPVRLSLKQNNLPYVVPMKRSIVQDIHNKAVKHLKIALMGARDVPLALLPLVQLLLAVGDVKGAYLNIEDCCKASNAVLPFSLKALLLNAVVPKSTSRLRDCYKEIVRRNPSSLDAIKALSDLHSRGAIDTVLLIESISQYLDVSEGITPVWCKLSASLLAIKREHEASKQKNVSVSLEDSPQQANSEQDTGKESLAPKLKRLRKLFMDRKDHWSYKHFPLKDVKLELQKGDKRRVAFKAACAAHLYGPDLPFVTGLYSVLKEERIEDLLELLKLHLQSPLLLCIQNTHGENKMMEDDVSS